MPNWCECELEIEGNGDIKKFKTYAKTGENVLDTNKFIPYPKKYKNQDNKAKEWQQEFDKLKTKEQRQEWLKNNPRIKDGFNSGGYEWCMLNWGTKWGIGVK